MVICPLLSDTVKGTFCSQGLIITSDFFAGMALNMVYWTSIISALHTLIFIKPLSSL